MGNSEHDEGFHGRRQDQVNKEEQRTRKKGVNGRRKVNTRNRDFKTRFSRGFFFHISLPSHTTRVLES